LIEELTGDDRAREQFLRRCSVYGALLALSIAGGPTGGRRFPLIQRDADWDALTDRLFVLVPELEGPSWSDCSTRSGWRPADRRTASSTG